MSNEMMEDERKAFKVMNTGGNIQVPGMALRSNAGLPTPFDNPTINRIIKIRRAIVFVDANNWYHNLKILFKPSKISIFKIANLICKNLNYSLKEIIWYASIPDISDGEKDYYDHMNFLSILGKEGVKVVTRKLQILSNKEILKKKGQIIESLNLCDNCKPLIDASFLDLAGVKRKEKGIDVWIAIDMVKKSVVENECDVCILISGDTDFVPAVKLIKESGKEVLTAFLPFGYSSELRNSTPYFMIRKETLTKCFRDYERRDKKNE